MNQAFPGTEDERTVEQVDAYIKACNGKLPAPVGALLRLNGEQWDMTSSPHKWDALVADDPRYTKHLLYTEDQLRAALASAEGGQGVQVPDGWKLVPVEFLQRFLTLAHNYSLKAEPPDFYRGVEGDAFSNAYRRCGEDLAKLRAMLAATPEAPAQNRAQAAASAERLTDEEIMRHWERKDEALHGRSAVLWFARAVINAHLLAAPEAPAGGQGVQVPQGWKLVPIEPTTRMCQAAAGWGMPESTWHEMLAAAPEAPAQAPKAAGEPVAMRGDFDGYGYRYIDDGSGSDWLTRHPDWEPLYTTTPAQASDAVRDVLAERQRQINAEGWTPEHDDEHVNGELARAGSAYALYAASTLSNHPGVANDLSFFAGKVDPWGAMSMKALASTERRNLVKAGALILAEIERLDRAARKGDKG